MSALNDRTVGYTNIPTTYKDQQYNLDTSSSKLAVREILQPSERFDPITGQSIPYGQNSLRSMQQNPPSRTGGGTTYTAWSDMVKDQADIANRELLNQKMDDKLRKQRYKEYLDKLAQEQKQSRLQEHAEHLNSYPNRDWAALKEFEQALHHTQQAHKREIRDSLDENFRLHMEKKNKLRQDKESTDAEMLRRFDESKKFEEFARGMEKERKNFMMNEQRTEFQKYNQHLAEQEQKRQVLDQEYNQKTTELLINKEKDSKQFYDRIRQQSLEKNVKGLENLQPFVHQEKQRNDHMSTLIEQSRLEKLRMNEEDQRARLERQRHLHMSSQMDNNQIMKVKMMEEQLKKQDADLKFQEMMRRIEETQKLEMMKRMSEQENRKNYSSILDHQVQERVHNKKHEVELNRIEQQFLARKDPEGAFIAVPNGKHSHERQLQLKYIDKWLVRNPEIPAEEHQRLRFKKDPVEQMNNYGGQEINGFGRRQNPII